MVKHFIDTSILRQLIASTSKTQAYYNSQFEFESIYVSGYVKMEYIRGFVINCMQFFGKMSMPGSNGYGDALVLWSHQFQNRSVKAVLAMAGRIFDHLKSSNNIQKFSTDRNFQEQHLGEYIRRLLMKVELYKNPGVDNELCVRSKYRLTYDSNSINKCFSEFIKEFNGKENSTKCGLKQLLNGKKSQFELIVNHDSTVSGFNKIKDNLLRINSNNKKQITCTQCSKIGDSIIAVVAPNNFVLDYSDHSFDDLTLCLNKKGKKHPSETAINSSNY